MAESPEGVVNISLEGCRWTRNDWSFVVRGEDLSAATIEAEVRAIEDAPGDPILDLAVAAVNYTGGDTSFILRATDSRMNGLPAAGVAGEPVDFRYDVQVTAAGGRRQRRIRGVFRVMPGGGAPIEYKFVKIGGGAGWNGGIYAVDAFPVNSRLWMEYDTAAAQFMLGWNDDPDLSGNYSDMEACMYMSTTGLRFRQSGANVGGIFTLNAGDLIYLENGASDIVAKKQDGTVLHTFAGKGGATKYADLSIYDVGKGPNRVFVTDSANNLLDLGWAGGGSLVEARVAA